MNCLACGTANAATVTYCQKCGKKLDLTADEIQATLVERARAETARNTEYYARRCLVFAVVLFLIGLTAFLASSGAPEATYFIPSASEGSEYVEFSYELAPKPEPLLIPLEP